MKCPFCGHEVTRKQIIKAPDGTEERDGWIPGLFYEVITCCGRAIWWQKITIQ